MKGLVCWGGLRGILISESSIVDTRFFLEGNGGGCEDFVVVVEVFPAILFLTEGAFDSFLGGNGGFEYDDDRILIKL